MDKKIAIIMDSIEAVNVEKDSSIAMLRAAQKRNWQVYYMTQNDVYASNGQAFARWQQLFLKHDDNDFYDIAGEGESLLSEFDVILMRKDPPFDTEYIYTTYLLELAEREGSLVVNKAQSLRDANEKFFTCFFPQCTPKTLISRDAKQLKAFWKQHTDVIFKPLEGMGGKEVFRAMENDPNVSVILETLTQSEQRFIMAQKFIPQINQTGDKRILLIDGKPVSHALARIPAKGETRGNLAAGARGEVVPLTERDYWLCEQVGPTLKEMGLIFVGLDVIGDYLTEINVTSPTCIREIEKATGLYISDQLIEAIEQKLSAHHK